MNQTVTNICTEEAAAQPTPGPWRVTEIGSVWSARNGLVAVVYPLATTYRDEMLANARLIAAAPDLLAFARRTLPMLIAERDCLYEGCTNAEGEYCKGLTGQLDRHLVQQKDREIDELRALIARAEGSA